MPSHVAVVVVHGIRTDGSGYSEEFRNRIIRKLARRSEYVEWREVFWGDVTRGNQAAYFERAKAKGRLNYSRLRWEFVLQGLGDAAAYIRTRTVEGAAYHRIQERLSVALDELDVPGHPERMLVLVGHSLGCQILSSYIWDINRSKYDGPADTAAANTVSCQPAALSPFRRLETLAGIVTLGSNIPLFTFAFSPRRVIPITKPRKHGEQAAFPGSMLPPDKASKAKWINFYSPFDLLGYPLKPLNPDYEQAVAMDNVVFSGGAMFWHPLNAHISYWTHHSVIKQTAALINNLIG